MSYPIRFSVAGMVVVLAAALSGTPSLSRAETPSDFLAAFEAGARAADSGFAGFSAARGELFFNKTHGREWSCSSCHTARPVQSGKHARTGKSIDPLSPNANAERFTRSKKVEKWFRRNCNDVLGRECSALEKGDVLTFLMAVKP